MRELKKQLKEIGKRGWSVQKDSRGTHISFFHNENGDHEYKFYLDYKNNTYEIFHPVIVHYNYTTEQFTYKKAKITNKKYQECLQVLQQINEMNQQRRKILSK